jgi:probable HAF family extracellular repeat protein
VKVRIARLAIPAGAVLAAVTFVSTFDTYGNDSQGSSQTNRNTLYQVRNLSSNGGTVGRGNSINNAGLVTGYSNLAGDQNRHATAWFQGLRVDLGTLGGPNSSVAWPVKNANGLIAGIAQTATPEPVETWSCAAFFFPLPTRSGYTCRGVVWEWGMIRALPLLGGRNSFAAGANSRGEVIGWSENDVEGSDCDAPQVFEFKPVVWGPAPDAIRQLPLISGDTSGAATAINDRGQVVGISGECDQAEGRHTAKHPVLWENGTVTDIGEGDLPAAWWNTPMAINKHGDVVGFYGDPADEEGNILHAFVWRQGRGIRFIDPLPGHVLNLATGINRWGQVVGTSCGAEGCHGFLWEHGVLTDLNDRLAPGYTNTLINAQDINDDGVITGRAQTATDRPAFVASPMR